MEKILKNDSGFTLLEVLMALGIFASFMASYVISESANVTDSTLMREDLILHHIAEEKLNQIVLDPPEFRLALTLSKDVKTVEKSGFDNYETIVQWKQLKIPDLSKIQGSEDSKTRNRQDAIIKKVFEELAKNIETMIWQLSVTARNKQTSYEYTLSTWLTNRDAEVQISL